MKNKNLFLYYDSISEEWVQASLEELAIINDSDLTICELDKNGNPGQQMSYGDYQKKLRDAYTPEIRYHYEVVEHSKYKGLGKYDVEGLKRKLNEYGGKGYKLVGVCSPSTVQTESIDALATSLSNLANSTHHSHNGINLQGVVAIMEKAFSRGE